MFSGKTLLITGGTGSFGNVVLERFLETDVKEIRIFSRDEKKQDDMRRRYNNPKLSFHIGDVRNIESVRRSMRGVDYIFHAAALKQVPSCEFFPMEAVQTNIIGTDNVLSVAAEFDVKRVVCLSTDKAAYPINAMGISKAMMERVIAARARDLGEAGKTVVCCTRYGNVMASRGSVIPLFIEQIKAGKDITITEPKMTRFLMNLNEAVDLVLFAFENAKPGDLFVQKAPSATIGDLAQALIQLFDSRSKATVIGARHGEKKYETLMTREESAKAEEMGEYFRIPADTRDLNYGKYLNDGSTEISEATEYNSENTTILDIEGIKKRLLEVDFVIDEMKGSRAHLT